MTSDRDDLDVDALLAVCASEPIHLPGGVQPHGVLLVLDDSGRIVAASENTRAFFGVDAASAIGATVGGALGDPWCDAVAGAMADGLVAVTTPDGTFECSAVVSGDLVMFEVERDPGDSAGDAWQLFQTLRRFHGTGSVTELAEAVVRTIADLTGFDRVMCYQFDPEWNGEVIAEIVGPAATPFLGLRFPASDIPPQARAQYERTPLRLIPDSAAVPAPLLAADPDLPSKIDLSDATLRAVSPVHLHYLRNMGVQSSMSVALTLDGRLWGIVACHHTSAVRRPSRRVRNSVDLVASTASLLLSSAQSEAAAVRRLDTLSHLDELAGAMVRNEDDPPIETLLARDDLLLGLVGATGLAVVGADGDHRVGSVPDDEVVRALVARARSTGPIASEASGALGLDVEPTPDAAGVLAVPVGPAADTWLVWFRPEVSRTVRWAGDPSSKPVQETSRGASLGPRSSFAAYVEEVRGRSEPWHPAQVEGAHALARRIAEADQVRAARETRLAAQLQRAILLESFPVINGVTGAAEYRPAQASPLGGDWYDVFFLPSGRSIIAVGDVAGHGFEVAATMAQLRHALRAYLVRAPLDVALSRLNHLTRTLLPMEMATVALAEIDPSSRAVRIATAGHIPPVVAGGGASRLVEQRGPALGVLDDAVFEITDLVLDPGQRIVLCSDGLIERRTQMMDERLAELRRAVDRSLDLDVSAQCIELVRSMTDATDVDDDVTVVVVELSRPGADPHPR